MKRKLLLVCAMLFGSIGFTKAADAYQTYLTAGKGWTQVTDLSSMTLSDYYFAIVSNDNTDLMVKMEQAQSGQQNSNHSMWYRDATDPLKDNSYLWTLETNSTSGYEGYTIRNVDRPVRVIQTNEGLPWYARTNWETSSARWTSYAFNLSDGKYTIQALANGDTYYLGLWTYSNGYVSGQELAGNKSGDEIAHFLLYSISKTTANAAIAAASDASSSAPYDLAPSLFGRATSDFTGATGYYGDYRYVETYKDSEAPSTGDKVTKTITTAPNGYHKITVLANAAWISGRGSVGTTTPTVNDNSTVVTINGVSQNVPVRTDGSYNPVTLTFHTFVTDNNISFKITNNDAAAFWFVWDVVSDLYYGEPSTSNSLDFTDSPVELDYKITNADVETDGDVSYSETVTGWSYNTGASNHGTLNSQTGAFTDHAFENWKSGGLSDGQIYQQISGLPDGVYKVGLSAMVRTVKQQFIYGKSNGKTYETYLSGANETAAAYNVYAIVDGGTLEMGLDLNASGVDWAAIDNATLTYYGTSAAAYALVCNQEVGKLESLCDEMTSSPLKTAMTAIYTEYTVTSAPSTVSEYVTAIAQLNGLANLNESTDILDASIVSAGANAISTASYKTATAEENTTFANAVAAHATTITTDFSTTVSAANATLKTAVKTYLATAEPASEGQYFDITCLMENPGFDYNTTTGWTCPAGVTATRSSCNEFFQKSFDIYQTVTGLPAGSYTLSVQAYQRPGVAQTVYTDYMNGTNNATTELYVNSTSAKAKHIAADASSTKKYSNDSEVTYNEETKYLPNSMEGARVYFDAGLYDATVAALVGDSDGGSLKLGFKSDSYVTADWTIFDNFRLRYYGSSKMIYYKQYLPQLEEEIADNYLNNGTYSVLKSGQTERTALETANAADADELETESEFEEAIAAIEEARDAFTAAKTVYDNLFTAYTNAGTDYPYYEGNGVFEMSTSQKTTFEGAVSTATSTYTTGTASKATAQAAIDAIAAAYVLNAPDGDTHYCLKVATSGHAKEGKAVVASLGTIHANNPTGYGFNASAQPAAYLAQSLTFTRVSGNDYNIVFTTAEGPVYLTYGSLNGSAATWKTQQIQGTTNSANAGTFRIYGTTTSGVFTIYNTEHDEFIACEDGGSLYTNGTQTSYSLAEVSQASVTVSAKAGKFGTVILPFTPDVSEGFDGITFYAFDEIADDKLNITSVAEPQSNTPYLVKNTTGSDFSKTLQGYGTASQSAYNSGSLYGVYTAATIPASDEDYVRYVLQTQSGTQAFYKVASDFTATAYKCYLQVPVEKAESVKAFFFNDELETAISGLEDGTAEHAAIYNLAGQRVSKPTKGLYIVDGKKRVIK